MTTVIALLLMSQVQKAVIFDRVVPVTAAKVARMPFEIKNPRTVIDLDYAVSEKNGKVKVVVRRAADESILGENSFASTGDLKVNVPEAGKIWIDLDNRASRLSAINVEMTIKAAWKVELPVAVREVPDGTRRLIVGGSLIFLFAVLGVSAWKLMPVWKAGA